MTGRRRSSYPPEVLERLGKVEKELTEMKLALAKYQGAVGGIMLVVGAIWACITLFGDYIKQRLFP